jgi:hypothetical protein
MHKNTKKLKTSFVGGGGGRNNIENGKQLRIKVNEQKKISRKSNSSKTVKL